MLYEIYNKLPDALKQEQSIMNFKRQRDQLDIEFQLFKMHYMDVFTLDLVK